jgi:hypothetical protein
MKYKNYIFVSNDFGFGPISRLHTIASALARIDRSANIRIVSSGKTDYLFNNLDIKFDLIEDLRSEEAIFQYIEKYNNLDTLIISSMNSFAIYVARTNNYTCVLLDGLYWFWKNRPQAFELADIQYRFVLPWLLEKFQSEKTVKYFAGPVERYDYHTSNKGSKMLITVNGVVTPFYKPEHDSYIKLFMVLVNNICDNCSDLSVTGNKSINILAKSYLRDDIKFNNYSKSEYARSLYAADSVLLNGGSNSFLETIVAKKDFLFILPSNQSQYALIDQVAQYTNKPIDFWCPALTIIKNHEEILDMANESSALDFMASIFDTILADKHLLNNMKKITKQIMLNIKEAKKQKIYLSFEESSAYSMNSASEVALELSKI